MKSKWIFWGMIAIFILMTVGYIYASLGEIQEVGRRQDRIRNCFNLTAKEYCESINLTVYNTGVFTYRFKCSPIIDKHKILNLGVHEFQFTEEEINKCDSVD